MSKRDRIKKLVLAELNEYVPPEITEISGHMLILKELKIFDDDASEAAMLLEKKTGARVPKRAWGRVATVDDLIDVLLEFAPD